MCLPYLPAGVRVWAVLDPICGSSGGNFSHAAIHCLKSSGVV